MSRLVRIKEQQPEALSNGVVVDIAEQADQLQELKALYDTDGGKVLVKLLVQDAINSVHMLRGSYRTATHTELITMIAALDAHLSTAQLLLSAKDGVAILDAELDEALRE